MNQVNVMHGCDTFAFYHALLPSPPFLLNMTTVMFNFMTAVGCLSTAQPLDLNQPQGRSRRNNYVQPPQ